MKFYEQADLKMDGCLQLKRVDDFDTEHWILYQKKDNKGIVSNPSGRSKFTTVTVIWKVKRVIACNQC